VVVVVGVTVAGAVVVVGVTVAGLVAVTVEGEVVLGVTVVVGVPIVAGLVVGAEIIALVESAFWAKESLTPTMNKHTSAIVIKAYRLFSFSFFNSGYGCQYL